MRKISKALAQFFSFYLPDALSFSLILSIFVFVAALIATPTSPVKLLSFWGDSLWSLHTFAMQMVLILLFGHLLAQSSPVKRVLGALACLPQSEGAAIVWLVLLSSLACWLNWGAGLMIAAALAISFKQRFHRLDFGFLVATGYAGFLVWHGGLSGSIPLSVAGEDKILLEQNLESLPLSSTILSSHNLVLVLVLVVALAFTALLLKTYGPEQTLQVGKEDLAVQESPANTFSERIQSNAWFLRMVGVVGFIYLAVYFFNEGGFHINSVNLIFFFLVLLAYGSIFSLTRELETSVRVVAPILIQYPLYAGVMGMIQNSGLAQLLSQFFVNLATPETFPLLTFWSAGLVNFFVPSGGGQWIIQGPVMLQAAQKLNVPIEKVVMAISWGDAWTNMIQPFWALPLLSLARLELKDIMSFCVVYLVISGLVISAFMLF